MVITDSHGCAYAAEHARQQPRAEASAQRFLLDTSPRSFQPPRYAASQQRAGYAPNTLGDVERIDGRLISGGLRQWETSVELRVPITESFGSAVFVDMGDVTRGTAYRFDHPQTSFGIGLRYRTIVGPLRFDAALAPPSLQVWGVDDRIRTGVGTSRLFGFADGAVHFTIGEAF